MPPFVVEKLKETANLPSRAHGTDAGLDLYSAVFEIIEPGATVVISTGIAIDMSHYNSGLVLPRSGLAAKGVTVMNAPGLIDPGYTGEVQVILFNSNDFPWQVHIGDRIAQLLIIDFQYHYPLEGKIDKNNTKRGSKGLGSTGQ